MSQVKNKTEIEQDFASIQKVLASGNSRGAQVLLNRILEQDILHEKAWQMLHQQFGQDKPFSAFQEEWGKRYFPNTGHILQVETLPDPDSIDPSLPPWEQFISPDQDEIQLQENEGCCQNCGHFQSAEYPFCEECGTNLLNTVLDIDVQTIAQPAQENLHTDEVEQCANCRQPRGIDHFYCQDCGTEYQTPPISLAPGPLVPPNIIQTQHLIQYPVYTSLDL